ncbi:hypothetical protein [Novosphingobium beihaiensis]|uniref:Uncharacterized protein n=1 Tax=Novosphingobium beihaiensis TaxID=2930389 RepID=A0ABT0BPR2_9SPHN|nr:hypothetical protein [Novosphingobium beihaiensis]MCJ2187037.1 hypothetical protein [Novosphingobium beihaiensis]
MDFGKRLVLMIAVTIILPMQAAHAYLDPASASLAMQALIGTVAAYLLTGKHYLRKMKSLILRKKDDSASQSDNTD